MNILVTGGAGYIGSVVVEELLKEGHRVVVFDNLSRGHRQAVSPQAVLVVADLSSSDALERALRIYRIQAVMHLAAESAVEASMSDPAPFFRCNVAGGLNLLEAMRHHRVKQIVFSSSAAVYGEPALLPIQEEDRVRPVNAMGESKAMFERMLSWYERAYGFSFVSLRYFNAAGATANYGEDHRPETHLIPIALHTALRLRESTFIYGTDYPTKDGTCLRDYIHISDIARAHILALEVVGKGQSRVYNLGNGEGFSVQEVLQAVQETTGRDIRLQVAPRRPGDPAVLVASAERIKKELGWQPQFPRLKDIVASAWEWQRRHPRGYAG